MTRIAAPSFFTDAGFCLSRTWRRRPLGQRRGRRRQRAHCARQAARVGNFPDRLSTKKSHAAAAPGSRVREWLPSLWRRKMSGLGPRAADAPTERAARRRRATGRCARRARPINRRAPRPSGCSRRCASACAKASRWPTRWPIIATSSPICTSGWCAPVSRPPRSRRCWIGWPSTASARIEFVTKVRGALTYPIIMMCVGTGIMGVPGGLRGAASRDHFRAAARGAAAGDEDPDRHCPRWSPATGFRSRC